MRQSFVDPRRRHAPLRIVPVPKSVSKALTAAASPVRSDQAHKVPLPHSGNISGWGFCLSLAGYVGALASLYGTGEASFRSAEIGLCLSFLTYVVYACLVEWQGYGWARCDHKQGTVGQKNHLLRCRKSQWPWCLTLMFLVVGSAMVANGSLITFAQLSGRYDAVCAGIALQLWLSWQVVQSVLAVRRFVKRVS